MYLLLLPSLVAVPAAPLLAPQSDDERFQALERRVETLEADRDRLSTELGAAMDVLAAAEVEGNTGGALSSSGGDARTQGLFARLAQRRLAPRAAGVYTSDGISVGGYGEYLAQWFRDQDGDNFDALRWVMYLGKRFSDRWIFNSEIEIEHGTTDSSSATTASGGSVSIEFAYIDHLLGDNVALRGGVLLVPLGFINERHEPTTYLPAARPMTETRIIPSTWRATGVGAFGDAGPIAWTAYVLNGLNGAEFDENGLRAGRQKGNRASIDDLALAARVDYVGTPGFVAGVSAHTGDAGAGIPEDLTTTIYDLHAEWNEGPFSVRALYAAASIDDTEAFNARTGKLLSDELRGWYVEAGYDLLSLTESFEGQSLDLFVRYEELDTQAGTALGASAATGIDDTYLTVGLNYRPLDQVVIKADYTSVDRADDVARFLIGYAF